MMRAATRLLLLFFAALATACGGKSSQKSLPEKAPVGELAEPVPEEPNLENTDKETSPDEVDSVKAERPQGTQQPGQGGKPGQEKQRPNSTPEVDGDLVIVRQRPGTEIWRIRTHQNHEIPAEGIVVLSENPENLATVNRYVLLPWEVVCDDFPGDYDVTFEETNVIVLDGNDVQIQPTETLIYVELDGETDCI